LQFLLGFPEFPFGGTQTLDHGVEGVREFFDFILGVDLKAMTQITALFDVPGALGQAPDRTEYIVV